MKENRLAYAVGGNGNSTLALPYKKSSFRFNIVMPAERFLAKTAQEQLDILDRATQSEAYWAMLSEQRQLEILTLRDPALAATITQQPVANPTNLANEPSHRVMNQATNGTAQVCAAMVMVACAIIVFNGANKILHYLSASDDNSHQKTM